MYGSKQKQWLYIISGVAAVIAFLFFFPSWFYFLNDDLVHIPLSKDGVIFQRNSFRPLSDLSIMLDYAFWKKNAAGYHAANLLLHAFNAFFVFLVAKKLFNICDRHQHTDVKSFMSAVLFFVYACHSESVFWILGRSASLATLFFLPALSFYLGRHRGDGSFTAAVILFAAALFAYESVWVFPLFAILFLQTFKAESSNQQRNEKIFISVVFGIFLLYLLWRFLVIREVAGRYEAGNFIDFNMVSLIANFGRLFFRSFLPPLSTTYFLPAVIAFFVVFIAIASSYSKKTKNGFFVLLALFVSSLIPYLSLGVSTQTTEGERFLYLPSVFACLLLIELVFVVSSKPHVQLFIFSLLTIFHLVFLYKSASSYRIASSISSLTFQEVNKLQGKQRLFIDSLPQNVNGAIVFRLGFEEGVKWLKEAGSVDSVIVLSTKNNNTNWDGNYKTAVPALMPQVSFDSILIRDTTHKQTYVVQKVKPLLFDSKRDALFVFHDDGLHIIK